MSMQLPAHPVPAPEMAGTPAAELQELRALVLAVAAVPSGSVFDELVRIVAAILPVEVVFIARCEPQHPGMLNMLALLADGQLVQGVRYPVAGTPCETVLGHAFRAYPTGVRSRFPDDEDALVQGIDSYAGYPLAGSDGEPVGIVAVASRQPLVQVERIQATLEILAVRASAELERLRASELQRQAVEDLRQREAQYRAIFESSLDGLFVWNEDLRVVDVNPAGVALYGVQRQDVVGRTFPAHMPQAYVQARLAMVRGALAGTTTHVETTVLRPDGSTFEADLRVMPFVQRGRPHALTVVRDITARRQAEQVLRDSEQQYRAIFNASVDALVLRAADFRIVDVNATYEAMSGFSRAEALGQARVLANPPEVGQQIRDLHDRALAGETVRLETQLLRRDGHRFDLELRGVPIRHRGEPHVLYIGRDITQAKHAERALRDSEEQYRAIFSASADALVLRDAHYRAVEVNPAYTSVSGYTREEVMAADHVLTQADSGLRDRHRLEHDRALAGKELRFEVTGTRKDGTTWQAEVRGTPMTYRGQPHVLYAVRDITERVAAERRRAELERQLRQAQKMEAIGQLTGGLAHDFNNILTSVLGYLSMAQERPSVAADAALGRQLSQARLAAERARDHVAQLLAFSRPQRGDRRLLDPVDVVRSALQLLRPNLPSSIAVSFALPAAGVNDAALPPVAVDVVQFEQVLLNLCLNARDAIGEQGTIRVSVGHSAPGRPCASCGAWAQGEAWVWFEVADDGRGMPREVFERMFEPFFTTKDVGRGTGMGLAMVHGIVHEHGGHIQVESAPAEGSRFRVLLPACAQQEPAAPATAELAPLQLRPPRLHGRVLLVEDEPHVGAYMQELLDSWGLAVELETDPTAAACRLADPRAAFDLLISDQTMPGMTGLVLARHARTCCPGLPVLLYTGNAADIGPDALAQGGVAELLRKPVDAARLRQAVQRLLVCPGARAG